jgi:outer membrane protein OmpA-like peptidoglycan-associated protein/tetratricopeptide (TPR) repeat protein
MRSAYLVFIFIVLLCNIGTISAQRALKKEGDRLYNAGKYREALNAYKGLKKINKDPQMLVKRGICYLETKQPDACIADMSAAHKLKSLNNKRFLYMAKAYESKANYVEAAKLYKVYLDKVERKSDEWYRTIHDIKHCSYAIDMSYAPQLGYVENLGSEINTIYDEFSPVQSPTDQERYYFSSERETATGGMMDNNGLEDNLTGKYFADMYRVDLRDGKWSSILPFEQVLNSTQHDILQDFSSDGMTMYFVKTPDYKTGVVYADTFKIERDNTSLASLASLPFKPELGDKDLFVFSDSMIIFSSLQYEGYGGYDLYYSVKHKNQWLIPTNLGGQVNSHCNEIGGFLVKNGRRIYYSSDRMESLGGFDIFESTYDDKDKIWSKPINQGSPINSPGNDIDIEVASDGLNALFTSDRVGTLGGKDLYIAYFKSQILDQLDFIDVPLFVTPVLESLIIDTIVNDTSTLFVQEKPSNPVVLEEKLPTKEFITKPLYFRDNDEVLNTSNQLLVAKIAELMQVYPEIKVALTSHFTPESRPDFDLYFSIKRAEKVSSQLVAMGIQPSRINVIGCGPNYPIAKHYTNGEISNLAAKTNRRIDVTFYNITPRLNIKIIPESPSVVDQFRDDKWDIFDLNNQGLTFRVKFATVNQMHKSELLSTRGDAIIQKNEEQPNEYIYTFGNETTYASARDIKAEIVRLQGRQDFIVVPYLYGVPMSKEQIISSVKDYPELEIYLKQE